MTTWEWIAGASLLWLGWMFGYMVGRLLGERFASKRSKDDEPELRAIQVSTGDTLVITYAGVLSKEQRAALQQRIERSFMGVAGVNVLILEGGVRLEQVLHGMHHGPDGVDRRRPVGQGKPVDWSES